MQIYSNPKRASDPHALPDIEVYCITASDVANFQPENEGADPPPEPGWYWWACFPGCLPDGEPIGPFATEAEAIADAQSGDHDE